ncbi:PREDICTED: 11-beta-hydroxysteroid dehydrogenase-like 4A isoform X2 [Nelumbo nucifera]|uniref:11-beta-hydroxysteroid dehydrogenase-like 4A isoform X2 n=1 Tax=Nelumbo nucifera TaxID=4432 RepID=A0A1U8B4S6_NELNU|nr:PREDICTED: 11-beta-hydroxysteroid dehydrogenase-like 4A isoform X2 [Nelumbo nucifera]
MRRRSGLAEIHPVLVRKRLDLLLTSGASHAHPTMHWEHLTYLLIIHGRCSQCTVTVRRPSRSRFSWLFSCISRSIFSENMAGKVVVITGGSSGIGEHIAYEYAKRRASLVLVARREAKLQSVAERTRQLGSPDVVIVPADVSMAAECKRFVEEAVNHFGRLDHLVCNAGVVVYCPVEDTTNVEKLRPVMDINFWGPVYATHFALPHLRKSKGRIIVNASMKGWLVSPWSILYGASKAAIVSFCETLRVELAQDVKVTIVAPGFVNSEITQGKHISKEGEVEVDQEMSKVMSGKFPVESTEDCARAIVDGVCRGDRYIIEPSWYRILLQFQFLCPELVEWFARSLYKTKPQDAATKRDAMGLKKY